ncbi:hypothetical protein [Variovorax ginsengisoli]|uniref:Uncharacterized protein n=1 Tax=Variovorax ginsengisoli TaxID=363844 RepID=A0ABT8SAJ5_9BURK|nr:hypothetical protein [Variovorax ginsengisoli]MDN8616288.1 hypothetical protein [Variovorax ginsengisoli]MDO1535458.1 hypothetical protein [Variovorax ginsengisoli]
MPWTDHGKIAGALVLVVTLALMLPMLRYLRSGWGAKRLDIIDGLSGEARLAYFQMFNRTNSPANAGDAVGAFEDLYKHWFGRRYFLWPGVLFFVVGFLSVALAVSGGLHRLDFIDGGPLCNLPDNAIYALAGAYLWVADDHISRARRLDFSPADVHWATLRFIIAIPMGYAFVGWAGDKAGFVAFALGAFPLGTLISMIQRGFRKVIGDTDPDKEGAHDSVIRLQGVNSSIAERLANEDITTIPQFAYCDPVRLVMRSNLSFNFVTDCMSQALAWIYFETHLAELRVMGLRGAVEIKYLIDEIDDLDSEDPAARACQAAAAATLQALAVKLDMTTDTVQNALRQIAEDPFTIFLQEVWTTPET